MSVYQIGTSQPGLTAAETVLGVPFRSRYSPGSFVGANSGEIVVVGYPRSFWDIRAITIANYASLKSTYLSGDYSGEVYIQTRDEDDTWKQWRALLRLPNPVDLARFGGKYLDVTLEFSLIEDVTP